MYKQVMEVSSVVKSTDKAFTALLAMMFVPEILITVGPGFSATFTKEQNPKNRNQISEKQASQYS